MDQAGSAPEQRSVAAAALAEKAATEEKGTRQEPKEEAISGGEEEAKPKKNVGGLLRYYGARYKLRTGSIFLDPLVGGMFLAYVLNSTKNCDQTVFTYMFFAVSLSHYVSLVLKDMGDYSSAVAKMDDVETVLERGTRKVMPLLLHGVRLVQYPLLAVLTGYVIMIHSGVARGVWTYDKKKADQDGMEYCEANFVHIALMTVIFQIVYGLIILVTWTVLWAVDRDDDQAEREEEQKWRKSLKAEAGTFMGNIKEFVLVLGMEGFFGGQVSSMFLTLSLALPRSSCNIHVVEWFLIAGVCFTLTDVLNKLLKEVQGLAKLDGIINKCEHLLIQFLRFLHFPLFVVEVAAFVMIVLQVIAHINDIKFVHDSGDSDDHPPYCELSVWKMMVGVIIIYVFVFVFRVVTIVGSLITDRPPRLPFPCMVGNCGERFATEEEAAAHRAEKHGNL